MLTVALAGCSTTSPATITTPYAAADGTSATIPGSGIKLNNFVVVSPGKGQPGQLIGAVVNGTDRPVTVTMQAELGATSQFSQTRISVRAHDITQVGPSGTPITITDTPAAPGALMKISANYRSAGSVSLTVPVVLPSGYYAGYTVAPTTEAPSPSSADEVSPSGTAEPTSS